MAWDMVDLALNLKKHINIKTTEAKQSFHRIARLANTERRLSLEGCSQIYLACITSISDYGSVI